MSVATQAAARQRKAAKTKRPRKESPAQAAAARKNLAQARKHRKPETQAQRDAARRNLAKARLHRHPETEKQRETARANLAKARAHKHPETEKQKEAARKNLAKARHAPHKRLRAKRGKKPTTVHQHVMAAVNLKQSQIRSMTPKQRSQATRGVQTKRRQRRASIPVNADLKVVEVA